MSKKIIYAAGIGLLSLQLLGCGGETTAENEEQALSKGIATSELCDYIQGRTYYTMELGEAGRTQTGIRLGHWSARFEDGNAYFLQSDFGLAGTYTCKNGRVLLTMEGEKPVSLAFDHNKNKTNSNLQPYQSFLYNPLGGDSKRYVAAEAGQDRYKDCQLVEGRLYSAITAGSEDAIPVETPFIQFGEGQTVEYDIVGSGQAPIQGIYECDLGEIHLHSDASDDNPVRIQLNDNDGDTLTAKRGDYAIEMAASGSVCAEAARELCVVEPQDIQCVMAPCPTGVHKSVLQSTCADDLATSFTVVHEGACGDLEGQPYYDEPVACTKEYAPVCAAAQTIEPCGTIPCPTLVHETFANSCLARAAQAHIIHEGECAKEVEGTVVTELTGACPAVFDPVCAKDLTPIVCVTEPCPNYQYQTFGNACEAFLDLAEVAFNGECGELENVLAFDNPLVKRVDDLPTTEKTVTVSNVRFDGDVLNVSLSYSGCDEQHFQFYASSRFMESLPVQIGSAFVPMVEDRCLAFFTTEFSYDLTPLKHAYQQAYQTETGTIELRGVGTYSF